MNPTQSLVPGPREALRLLAEHRWRWLAPAVVVAALAAVYALVVAPTWRASQALILRNEAANGDTGLGKFSRPEDMKNLQETALELAKGRGVLMAALQEVGPPEHSANHEAWPTDRDVDDLRQAVKLAPPKGVEFGTAEMFYLETRSSDRTRAVRLNEAICRQLQARFQELRDAKAQSMIDELTKTVHLAKADLNEATARLAATEKQVGSDLPELRTLQDSNTGEGTVRRMVSEIENELRQARSSMQANEQLLDLLRASKGDAGKLQATPTRFLDAQPGLKRLKEGLVDAQLRTAALLSKRSETHPAVLAAKEAEEEIGRHLQTELTLAIRAAEADHKTAVARTAMLDGQLVRSKERLARLAELRAPYTNQVTEMNHRSKLLERAEQNLSEARAAQASANAASLISRIDSPDTGVRPVSPSRAAIVLVGLAGGLLTGLGVLLLTVRARAADAVDAQGAVQTAEAARQPRASQELPQDCAIATPRPRVVALPSLVYGRNLSLREALERIAVRTAG